MHNTTRRVHALKLLISLALFSCSWLAMSTQSLAAVGDVNYISDVLTVPLRSGPSTAHRILHRGLPSGTQLTILAVDEEAGFTQVRTASGLGRVAHLSVSHEHTYCSGQASHCPETAFKTSKPKWRKNAKHGRVSRLHTRKPMRQTRR